ncbi:MAG TPA: hypothetical protein VGH29_05375, partial [Candidatus Binataceae bacterium]
MDLRIIVLLIAGLLVIISLVQPIAIRLGLSFAVLLAVVGVGMGLTASLVVGPDAVKTPTAPSLQPPSLQPPSLPQASLPGPGFGPSGAPAQSLNPPAGPPSALSFKDAVTHLPEYLHSDVFLYVFLPLLLFQSALTI